MQVLSNRNIRDWTDDPAGFLPVQGELKKMQLGDVEKEKMPEKRIGLWLTIGLVIVVFGIVNFGMRKNAEGLRILLFIFLGYLSGGKVWIWIVPESAEA